MLAFLFTSLAPGTYFDEMRLNPQIAPETVAALRAQYGVDKPLPVRYLSWLSSALHGEMDSPSPITAPCAIIAGACPEHAGPDNYIHAARLGDRSTSWIWSAERLGRLPDRLLSWGTAILLVIPDLALALGLLVLAVRTGWFPTEAWLPSILKLFIAQ